MAATLKRQGKYMSVKATIILRNNFVKNFYEGVWQLVVDGMTIRWYPGNWTLKEKKARDQFQAVLQDCPEELDTNFIINNREFIERYKIKAFKFVIIVFL